MSLLSTLLTTFGEVKNNLEATVPPTVNDDNTQGYSVSSLWFDISANEYYRCLDASTGVAIWAQASIGIDDLGALAILDTVSSLEIDPSAVTYSKIQDISATDRILGRETSGPGSVEEIVCTSTARSILDDNDVNEVRNTIELGSGDTPTFAGIFASSVTGGTGSGDNLTFNTTTDTTKGNFLFNNGDLHLKKDKALFRTDDAVALREWAVGNDRYVRLSHINFDEDSLGGGQGNNFSALISPTGSLILNSVLGTSLILARDAVSRITIDDDTTINSDLKVTGSIVSDEDNSKVKVGVAVIRENDLLGIKYLRINHSDFDSDSLTSGTYGILHYPTGQLDVNAKSGQSLKLTVGGVNTPKIIINNSLNELRQETRINGTTTVRQANSAAGNDTQLILEKHAGGGSYNSATFSFDENQLVSLDKNLNVNGVDIAADSAKLAGIEDNANNYVLPSDVVQDPLYVHKDNNFTNTLKNKLDGLIIGTTVQAYDVNLTQIAGLNPTDSKFIVGSGSAWVLESGSTARASLGLGSLATLSSINNFNWSGTDLSLTNGGTGASNAIGARNNLELGTTNAPEFAKLGIGAASLTNPLYVFNDLDDVNLSSIYVKGNTDESFADILFENDANNGLGIGINPTGVSNPNEAFIFNFSNNAIRFGTNGVERLRIENDGHFLSTSVTGTHEAVFRAGGNENCIIQMLEGAFGGGLLKYDGSSNDFYIGTLNGTTEFTTLRIPRGVNRLGINVDPLVDFHVGGDTQIDGVLTVQDDSDISSIIGKARIGYFGAGDWGGIGHRDNSAVGDYSVLQNSSGRTLINSSSGQLMEFRQNNLTQMYLASNGNFFVNNSAFKPGGGSWGNSSDRRLKKNITPISDALDSLSKLQGTYYNRKSTDKKEGGFIAQDVQKYFPDWVEEDNKGFLSLSLPFEFDALVVNAIKELKKEIINLKRKING